MDRLMTKVDSFGRVSVSIPMMLKEKCRDFELEPFPFDAQNCSASRCIRKDSDIVPALHGKAGGSYGKAEGGQ